MKKLNNSGFSLVELIIVMAIMAILTVAVAPQYLKYVERSRKAVDVQTMATVITAIDIYAADPVVGGLKADDDTSIAFTQGGTTSVGSGTGIIHAALKNAGISEVTLKSKQWQSGDTLTLEVAVDDNGVPSYKAQCQNGLDIIKGITDTASSNN